MAHSDAKSEEVDIEAQANLRRKSFESLHERHAGATDLASNSSDAKHEESSDAVVVVQDPKTRDPAFLVGFNDLDDPENPKNWPTIFRWYLVVFSSLFAGLASFASSAPSGIVEDMAKEFDFSIEVGTLTISVYLLGFVLGPLLWGPISETYGRRLPFIISSLGFTFFQIGCALSQNTAQIQIFRFLTGAFAACPLSNSPGVISDICHPKERAVGVGIYTLAPLAGPVLGPICSGFIHVSGTSWRWMYWVLTISGAVLSALILLTLRETYPPLILVHKAERLRKETGDERWYAPLETKHVPLGARVRSIIIKPWAIFFREPILICIHIYTAFQYGVLYLAFESYPIVFGEEKGWNAGLAALPFIGIGVGGVFAVLATIFYFTPRYTKRMEECAPDPVPPEGRLPPSQLGSVVFMISFFIFAWSSYPHLNWAGPTIAGAIQAFGVTSNFVALTAFIIDAYVDVAASAIATNVVLRSAFGAGFPLFARQLYEGLNPRWAGTLLGFIALIMTPIPWLFVRYGPYLRSKSRYAPTKTMTK